MIGWRRGVQVVQRNSLHGHLLADLFCGQRRGFEVIQSYAAALINLVHLLRFTSAYVNEYYYGLWISHTKDLFRVSIKLFLTTCVLFVLRWGIECPIGYQIYTDWWLYSFILFAIFYIGTFRNLTYRTYEILSLASLIVHICIQFPVFCTVATLNLPCALPKYVTVFSAFALLPLSIEVSVCVIAVYITLSEGLEKVYDSAREQNTTSARRFDSIPWTTFDIMRLAEEFHQLSSRGTTTRILEAFEWMFVCFAALYLGFWGSIRRRFVFFKLGKSVQARNQCETARQGKVCWIEAIVPSKVSHEYQRMRKINEHLEMTEWIYIQTYESVTMLFADIVGFTKMSSGLTASQVVRILGNLVRQFDALCEMKHCEKLGLIGDCYYCVSGCPERFKYHARSCTEMGLGMCEILKLFNKKHGTDINIRVGVHTGRAHAAVIGAVRFHYDVYSYDAIIANELEQSGRPGWVHISHSTYEHVHKYYRAIPGPELLINREDAFGWARQVPESVRIFTYFIEPGSTNIRQTMYQLPNLTTSGSSSTAEDTTAPSWSSFESDSFEHDYKEQSDEKRPTWREGETVAQELTDIKMSHQANMAKLKRDITLINDLRADPANHRLLFQHPPITAILLQFRDPEVEWHYQLHMRQAIGPSFVDSEKLARVCDAVILFVTIVLILVVTMVVGLHSTVPIFFYIYFIIAGIIFAILCFTGTNYPDRIKSKFFRKLYYFCTHPMGYELILSIYTLLPTAVTLEFIKTVSKDSHPDEVSSVYFTFMAISTLVHCLPSSSAAWARGISVSLTVCSGFIKWESEEIYDPGKGKFCAANKVISNGILQRNSEIIAAYEGFIAIILIYMLSRHSERTNKLCFLVHREAEIESESAELAAKEANEFLYNIIPRYVFRDLERTGRGNLSEESSSLRYAVTHGLIAVAFISVSNFFSTLYREDRQGGAASLRLLHRIICSFDNLLKNFTYVEKIKSIRENYLVASGLNSKLVQSDPNNKAHMVELMRYCILVRDALHKFGRTELGDPNILVSKIGYNCGPVTAGIIGTAKPHYDIWGDTVNVASRMCYTGSPGLIQVTEHAREELEGKFLFSFRGEFYVKGKGIMRTYVCDGIG